MEPRRKPIANPIARGDGPRALSAATWAGRSVLPTVAALLAATTALACQREPMELDITPDRPVTTEVRSALHAHAHAHDPLPGMGALETETAPPPKPYVPLDPPPGPRPTSKPYPVKGGVKHVIPRPLPPPVAGGIKPMMPPPLPAPTTPKPGTKAPAPVVPVPAVETT